MIPELRGVTNEPMEPEAAPQQEQASEGTDYLDDFLEGDDGQGQSTPEQSENTTTFFDASKVPPELQDSFREMQGDYTRKTQEVAQLRRQYEGAMSQFESVNEKASVMDRLLQDPRFQDFINTVDQDPQQGTGYQEDALVDPNVRTYFDQVVQPLQRRVDELSRRNAAGQELAHLAVKRPDYKLYEADMLQALKENPSRSLEDAYNAAVIRKLDGRRATLNSQKRAQSASVEGRSPAVDTSPVAEINDIHDAFRQARQMLKISDGELGRMSMKRG